MNIFRQPKQLKELGRTSSPQEALSMAESAGGRIPTIRQLERAASMGTPQGPGMWERPLWARTPHFRINERSFYMLARSEIVSGQMWGENYAGGPEFHEHDVKQAVMAQVMIVTGKHDAKLASELRR